MSRAEKAPGLSFRVVIGTLCGNGFLVFGTLILASVAVLFGWIGPRGRVIFAVARVWSRGLLFCSGVRVVPDFETPLRPEEQFVFMANHRSLFDIPALIATLPGQTRFLAKKSLFQIPLFGWVLKMGGFVTVDRKDLSTARESFAVAVANLAENGVSVLVFPEGTRSMTDELLPFQRGGFLLALKSGLAIVPIGIAGSAQIQPRRQLVIRPGTMRLHYGRPVPIEGFGVSRKQELIQEIRDRVEHLVGPDQA